MQVHQQEPEPVPLPALPAPPARQQRDWDVSRDPQLAKQLEVAKRLGQKAPPQESNSNIDTPELITRTNSLLPFSWTQMPDFDLR